MQNREFHPTPETLAAGHRLIAEHNAARAALRRAAQKPVPERMAEAMREISGSGQTVDADALANRGFTRDEIERHAAAARDMANRRQVRRVG